MWDYVCNELPPSHFQPQSNKKCRLTRTTCQQLGSWKGGKRGARHRCLTIVEVVTDDGEAPLDGVFLCPRCTH